MNLEDYKFGLWISENTPKNSIFLSYPLTSNPISTIGGRQVFFGFNGWVYSHGLNLNRNEINENLLKNPYQYNKFKEYNIEYLMLRNNFEKINLTNNHQHLKKIYFNNRFTLFKIV